MQAWMQTWILVLRAYSQSTEFVCGWDSLLISLLTSRKKGKASPPQGDRFGLRLEPIPALLRAHLFQGGDYHAKQFIAVQVEFTAIGHLTLEINKILADPHCFLGLGLANRTNVSMG